MEKDEKCCDSRLHTFTFLIWTSLGLAVCDKMDASAGNRTRAARALQLIIGRRAFYHWTTDACDTMSSFSSVIFETWIAQ